MDRHRRGRSKKLPKIDQYCSQPLKESKTLGSASIQSLPEKSEDLQDEDSNNLKMDEIHSSQFHESTGMLLLKEDNSRIVKKNEASHDMDDSFFMDFKTPLVKKKKVQSKLPFSDKPNCKDGAKNNKAMKPTQTSAAIVSNKIETVIRETESNSSSGEPKDATTMDESSDERSQDGSTPADQKSMSLCPMCWKRFDKVNIVHLKTCAAKHNMTTLQLMDAMALQDKQTAEREALGLPAVPSNQTSRKPALRKNSGESDSNDPNLQLALALSVSMQEAEEQQLFQEEEVLIEAGLGQEVFAKQKTLLERFGFTNSRPAIVTASSSRPRGKNKLKSFPTLLLRTQEDRDRLITEKVAIILMGDESALPDEPVESAELTIKSQFLHQYLNEECDLWTKSSASPSRFEKTAYYVKTLANFILPSKVEAGSKLKHLSQIPCRLKTPTNQHPSTFNIQNNSPPESFYPEINETVATPQAFDESSSKDLCVKSDIMDAVSCVTPVRAPKGQGLQSSSNKQKTSARKLDFTGGFTDNLGSDWRAILNKKELSDITIYVKNRLKIPAHELVFYVRCRAILQDIIVSDKSGKSLLWTNVGFRPALAFLEYIYCGSINKILNLREEFDDIGWLVGRYEIVSLIKHLEVVANVRGALDSRTVRENNCKETSREVVLSQSMITPKYKSPRKHHLGLNQTPKLSPSKKRRSRESTFKSLEVLDLDSSVNIDGEKSASPDPFSDSRNNNNNSDIKGLTEDDASNLPPTTQENINCLLELMDSSSPVESQSSDVTVDRFNMSYEHCWSVVNVESKNVTSDSETVKLDDSPTIQRPDLSDETRSVESGFGSPQVHTNVSRYNEKSTQNHDRERNNLCHESDVLEVCLKTSQKDQKQSIGADFHNKSDGLSQNELSMISESAAKKVTLASFTTVPSPGSKIKSDPVKILLTPSDDMSTPVRSSKSPVKQILLDSFTTDNGYTSRSKSPINRVLLGSFTTDDDCTSPKRSKNPVKEVLLDSFTTNNDSVSTPVRSSIKNLAKRVLLDSFTTNNESSKSPSPKSSKSPAKKVLLVPFTTDNGCVKAPSVSDKSPVKKILRTSHIAAGEPVPSLQQQKIELIEVCDLTQSSDDDFNSPTSSHHKIHSHIPRKESSYKDFTHTEHEKCQDDISLVIHGKKTNEPDDEALDVNISSGNVNEELAGMLKNKEEVSSEGSIVDGVSRISQKFPLESKRKNMEDDSPLDVSSPVHKKPCTDYRNSVRKSLIQSFVDESLPNVQEPEEIVLDLTQVSDNSDPSTISPLGSNCTESKFKYSPKKKGSINLLNKSNTINPVPSDSTRKSEELIETDQQSDTPKGSVCDKMPGTISSPNSQCSNDSVNDIDCSQMFRDDHGNSPGNSDHLDVYNEVDYFDYNDSPCRPYVSRLDPSPTSPLKDAIGDTIAKRRKFNLSQNDSFFENGGLKPGDAIELDDSFKLELQDNNSTAFHQDNFASSSSKLNKSSSSVRRSLDACKRLLEDSFGDKLGNLSLWKDENCALPESVACSTPKGLARIGRSTPKTPLQRIKDMESHNVTPLADYSAMDTPLLKKELHKYGIKPLKRKQAKLILRHIYNELHPLVPIDGNSGSSPPAQNCFKEPNKDTKVPKSPAKRTSAKQTSSPSKNTTRKRSQPLEEASDDSDFETGSSLSSSQNSSINSSRSDLIGADDVLDEPGLTQKEPSSPLKDLPDAVREFIIGDPVLHQKVLLYEPIWLEQLHADLKARNYKFKMDQLMHYLDGQCITFRTSQQSARREARKKKSPKKKRSPKRKQQAVKCSQREKKKEKGPRKKIDSSSATSSSQSTDSASR